MATRSTIALEYFDGTIKQVYCHWDGYLEHNGRILSNFYKDQSKVATLIECGAVSSLGPAIGEKHVFGEGGDSVCTFYARDRDEDVDISEFKDFEDYVSLADFQEYNYLFRNDEWLVKYDKTRNKFVPLGELIRRNQKNA